ncbi:protein transport protein SEC24 C [Physcomitrium patens]|uniref:COP-II coat subunit n=2 Tax=Physcomitrium patens TaxID=3218 RepID=A0A7I4BUH1_PHYPA|nr:protein transport protein Sec24-like At4g32640 [Physcomitrium patens]XP_024381137.1 protein transport protein Sec24-like At4g32640 [Physcomitrium patens]XP_024381147.1 protein transport protein Sec24-like At4g32640 [Physcomitrium patens]|eukprot:XP_024381127.1 protein transport protein Sec24-like At4g32640 [Physcomitrella patens]
MGREGEWPGHQHPEGTPQPAGYAPQSMQSYSGASGGQYAQGIAPMQPGLRGPPPTGPPPSLYGNAAPPFRPPGPPPGSTPPGVQPQWGAPPSRVLARPSPVSGPPGPPPISGPPGLSSFVNRSYIATSPAGDFPHMRPEAPPATNPSTNSITGTMGHSSGPFGGPGGFTPGGAPAAVNRPAFSAPQSTPPAYQPARPSSAVASSGPPMGPPSLPYQQQSSSQVPLSSAPAGPPSFSYQQAPANGPPQAPPTRLGGSTSQFPGQGPSPAMGQSEALYRPMHSVQGAPGATTLAQQFQRMSMGQPGQQPPGPPGPPSFSAPSQPVAGASYSTPSTWQTPARRVYPEAYGGQPQSGSMPPVAGGPQQLHGGQPYIPGSMAPSMQTMSQPGSPAGGQPGSASRIDPNQIPRPQSTASPLPFDTRVNGMANLPPSATTHFVVRDTGNCSPRFMRCTLNQIPCSGDLLANSGMPLAVMVQPLALQDPAEEAIQVVDFGESGPVRCSAPQCKAYINPFMRFIDQGRRFTCNLCGYTSETPRDYLCNLGPDGRRRDADMRPELSRGTVEFVAPKEYMVRPPMPQVFFFLVDVSVNAVSTGAVASACSAINRVLADLGDDTRTLVGIATFDSTVHFYNLNTSLQSPSMLVVPDIQDVYTPRQTDLLVPLAEGRDHLEQLLETIPSMFQNNRIPDAALGAAVKGAYLGMKATGGKLLVFQTVLPSVGFGALTAREAESKVNEKEAQKLLQPSDKILKTLALELAEFQVCVDLFLATQSFVDIASLAVLPRSTGGQIYYYHEFQAVVDSAKLYNDLRWNLTRPQGLEGVMRVRCSNGMQVQDYYGNFCKRNPTDVDLPAIDCDKTIMVTFKHDDKFQDNADCCFQSALLYTTTSGQRRIRLNTLSLSCSTALTSLFRGADLDAQFTHFLKQAAQDVLTTQVAQERDRVSGQCVNILYTYRKFCATASSSGQLILPEALKLLPLYTMALTKSVGLRTDARIDERSYWITRAASLSAPSAIPLVYPRLFALHNLPSKEDLRGVVLPSTLSLSSENLELDGIYLLENGEDALLYVNSQASREVLHQLFGVCSVDELAVGQFSLQEYDNELSRRLNEVVNEIRRQRCSYLRLCMLKRGDPRELLFYNYLVEDKSALGLSYVEYLVQTHRQIQNRMT